MKKQIKTIFCFFCAAICVNIQLVGGKFFIKSGIVSNELDNMPNFRIYYRGMQTTNNKDGFFSIPLEDGKKDEYSLLICKDFYPQFGSINTIKNLAIKPKKYDKFYVFTKATIPLLEEKISQLQKQAKRLKVRLKVVKKKKLQSRLRYVEQKIKIYEQKRLALQNESEKKRAGDFWLISKKKFSKKKFIVPDHCVIACINPKTVKSAENWNFSLPSNFIA
jgi:hypothetical protein